MHLYDKTKQTFRDVLQNCTYCVFNKNHQNKRDLMDSEEDVCNYLENDN